MFRTTALVLGLTLLASAAHAEDYRISLQDKSPAQVHADIAKAATKACNAAYPAGTWISFYNMGEFKACKVEAIQSAQAQADAVMAASADAHIATNASR